MVEMESKNLEMMGATIAIMKNTLIIHKNQSVNKLNLLIIVVNSSFLIKPKYETINIHVGMIILTNRLNT